MGNFLKHQEIGNFYLFKMLIFMHIFCCCCPLCKANCVFSRATIFRKFSCPRSDPSRRSNYRDPVLNIVQGVSHQLIRLTDHAALVLFYNLEHTGCSLNMWVNICQKVLKQFRADFQRKLLCTFLFHKMAPFKMLLKLVKKTFKKGCLL
jgi:hypothetical protein